MTKRKRRTFSKEFKEQIVQLHASGKPGADVIKEYGLTPSSFEEKENRTPEQGELIKLRKENQRFAMEDDILKQAALIKGRK
jgi:transposase